MKTLRSYLPRPRYTLTAALPAGEWCLRNIDLPGLLCSSGAGESYLDYLHVMTYDFSGSWTELSGHQAQLHAPQDPPNAFAKRSIARITQYLVHEQSLEPAKLVMGVPVYGRSFHGVNGPGEKFTGHGGDVNGLFEYRDLPRPGTKEVIDETHGAASCSGGDGGWVSYDCPTTVYRKGQFVKKHGLAGLFFWTGSFDSVDEKRSLVVAGHRSLHG
jgi:chitinase